MICHHLDREIRRRTYSNGRQCAVAQCLTCGAQIHPVKRGDDFQRLPCWDPELGKAYKAARREEMLQVRNEGENIFREYVRTDEWEARRQQRLAYDQHQCQALLPGCEGEARQVHHTTYEHIGNEPLWELRSVCRVCHMQIVSMDR